jgi:hypothetical protein
MGAGWTRLCLGVLLALACGLGNPSTSGSTEAPRKLALLIAIQDYSFGAFRPLRGTINDLVLMEELLRTRFDFKKENIVTLKDSEATNIGIKQALRDLAAKARQGDVVYIHYSGHGSQKCDLTGSEESGKDSTLVSYGARSGEKQLPGSGECEATRHLKAAKPQAPPKDPDSYDVVDKEINYYLSQIQTKTDHIIFVADSCHSGSITRDAQAVATRGVPFDPRPYPQNDLPQAKTTSWAAVSACGVEQKAHEHPVANAQGQPQWHGLFTWCWVQALQEARPQETWEDVVRRTSARMSAAGYENQRPEIEGKGKSRQVFGGYIDSPARTVPVLKVMDKGKVQVGAGRLLNVNPGAVFRKYDPKAGTQDLPTLRIVSSEATYSFGETTGSLKAGDLLIMETYVPTVEGIRVFVKADLAGDKPLAEQIRQLLAKKPAYELVDDISQCKLALYVLRPKVDAQGKAAMDPQGGPPQSSAGEKPVCWFLNPAKGLYDGQENLKTSLVGQDSEISLEALGRNLDRLAKVNNLLALRSSDNLAGAAGGSGPIEMQIRVHELQGSAKPGDKPCKGCVTVDGDPKQRVWKYSRTVGGAGLDRLEAKPQTLLGFDLKNNSPYSYYVYLINITKAGQIETFFPNAQMDKTFGLVRAGESRRLQLGDGLVTTEPVEYIRLIASRQPIDIAILRQDEYRTRGDENPLERLLRASLDTRGERPAPMAPADWSTMVSMVEMDGKPAK